MPERVCLHKSCNCEPAPESDYCSETCYAADRANPQEGANCACGHPGCRPANVPAGQPDARG